MEIGVSWKIFSFGEFEGYRASSRRRGVTFMRIRYTDLYRAVLMRGRPIEVVDKNEHVRHKSRVGIRRRILLCSAELRVQIGVYIQRYIIRRECIYSSVIGDQQRSSDRIITPWLAAMRKQWTDTEIRKSRGALNKT